MKAPSLKTLCTQGTYLVFLASMAACSSSSSSPSNSASADSLDGAPDTSQDSGGDQQSESGDQSDEGESNGVGGVDDTTDQDGEGQSNGASGPDDTTGQDGSGNPDETAEQNNEGVVGNPDGAPDQGGSSDSENEGEVDEMDDVDLPDDNPGNGEDPLIPNSTQVNFDIQVPAYRSNALKVELTWGARDIPVSFVGDEFWSATDSLPTDSEELLTVTFFDNNGDITLASFETDFRTGINAAEDFVITGGDFDSQRWDDDNDGQSNLNELIAGTYFEQATRVLLFSEARGFAHDSIPAALTALEELAASVDIQTDRAADSTGVFVDENLANYDAVYWVLTSGDVLNDEEQAAFERYIQGGGGYAGIHAASDTEYEWPWYGQLVGAYFARHPAIQTATQIVENGSHESTSHLNETWVRTDEWYDFQSNPRGRVNVLLTLDEDSYSGGGMGEDHPSAWFHEFDGGRSWYTGGGHTQESYAEPDFRAHLLGGMNYAAGL